MLEAAEEAVRALGCERMYVHARLNQPGALKFFEAAGFYEPDELRAQLSEAALKERDSPVSVLKANAGLGPSPVVLMRKDFDDKAAAI
mmetsp:Transcript_31177/g.101652  ORF Transcript_31177/g.101652 Transcript_31177/m.101652 type:complete len:88 (+) Transcript_31177:849-1112(+)